jgi:hypothetical protein
VAVGLVVVACELVAGAVGLVVPGWVGAAVVPVPPSLDERTTATMTPASAATATTAASTAFLTEPEATLARPWLHVSKSS